MNETITTILDRRSIRSYTDRPVEQDKIEAIIKCGQYAPSAVNRQPWHFTVVTDRGLLDKISAENKKIQLQSSDAEARRRADDPNYDNFRGAPMAIIVSGEADWRYVQADCANAMENMALAAHSLGLGGLYIASFKMCLERPEGKDLLAELGIPQGYAPLYALALGYGDEELEERAPRRPGIVNYI